MTARARTAWLDVSAGVAGDMLLAALVDAGAPLDGVQAAITAVVGDAVTLRTEQVQRAGLRALRVRVELHDEPGMHRAWRDIAAMLGAASLHQRTRDLALDAFSRLAAAEGRVHGIDPEDVHFHEVGSLDAIADVVGVCEAVRLLGLQQMTASVVSLGSGRIRAAHGSLPVPPPAVTELALGWPTRALPGRDTAGHSHEQADTGASDQHHDHHHDHDHDHQHEQHEEHAHHEEHPAQVLTPGEVGELATPTGMALVRALAAQAGPLPEMVPVAVGVGAGGKDMPGWANCVRVVIGDPQAATQAAEISHPGGHRTDREAGGVLHRTDREAGGVLHELRANLDDLDARLVPGVIDQLLALGAVDSWVTPIQMKRGRPGLMLQALVPDAVLDAATDAVLHGTTSLGVRSTPVRRTVLDRCWLDVDIDGQPVAVKIGSHAGRVVHASPEFVSVTAAAAALGRREADLLQRAVGALVAAGLVAGAPVPIGIRAQKERP